ncbi:MAG TPA: 8-amino-7-oxononanoate synthase, partial [Porphyromonadaceae bacterium]|nr:8-amino-7-oxononanoate synthase [Porphyromonadaceae bacterium]
MNRFEQELSELKEKGSFRSIPPIEHEGKYIIKDNQKLVNLSGNDYLGLASRLDLLEQFKEETQGQFLPYSSSSSRLLTGNFPIYEQLESLIAASLQHEAALLFNSGYHANIGILPAITTKRSLIVADKLVHASLIDGIRLSNAQ